MADRPFQAATHGRLRRPGAGDLAPRWGDARGLKRGYTLLEMLVVLAILAVLVGLSWPSLARLAGRSRVKDAAKQVRRELAEARLRAIESGRIQVFRFQPGTRRFEVAAKENESAGPAVLPSALEQLEQQADAVEPLTGSRITDPKANEKSLPDGVFFAGQEVAQSEGGADQEAPPSGSFDLAQQQAWSEPIVFFPDGRTSNAAIRLTDGKRYVIDLSLRGLTGTIRIGPATKLPPPAAEEVFGGSTLPLRGGLP